MLQAVADRTALAPDREHRAVVDALAGAAGNGDHVAGAACGERIGNGQHTQFGLHGLFGRRMWNELQVVGLCFDRDDAIARPHFAATVLQQQGGGLGIAGGGAAGDRADVDLGQLIAEELAAGAGCGIEFPQRTRPRNRIASCVEIFVVLWQAELRCRPDHCKTLAWLGIFKPDHVGDLLGRRTQPIAFQAHHIRQFVEVFDHAQVLQERLDVGQRNGVDRCFLARAGLYGAFGDAVQVGQADHVTRVDQMRILDLRIGLPDFRPQPRFFQKAASDIPKGIPLRTT